jgi:hypothetical protein
MLAYWKSVKLRKALNDPDAASLAEFVHCFGVGYQRGLNDTCAELRSREWAERIAATSLRLARERSHAEAGCWLAGVIIGCDAVAENNPECNAETARAAFFAAWNRGYILACAEQTVSSLLRRDTGPVSLLLELDEAVT